MQRSECHFDMPMIADSCVISDPNSKLILSASLARFKKSQTENWAFHWKKSLTVKWTDDEDAGNKSQLTKKKWENKMKTNMTILLFLWDFSYNT